MSNVSRIPIYDVNIDDENLGLFGISYVDAPAIMEEMVAFKNEEIKVYLVSNEKHEIVSPVLIPNQLIYREYDGMPCYIRFSEETIRKAAERYLLKGYFNNWTLMHENIDDDINNRIQPNIFTKRIWIIEDEQNDDANTKYGFNLPKGTLMVHAKVNNRQIWQMIKEGKIRGLSMEAILKLKSTSKAVEISYSKMDNKFDFTEEKMNLFQKFVAFLNEVSADAEGIASEAKKDETNSGEVSLKYYLDDEHYFEVDAEGYVKDENGEKIAEGEYKLADTSIFVVDSEGKFVETKALDENAGEEQVEAPIAEGFKEEKKDEKEDETTDGETSDETDEVSGETTNEDSTDNDKDSTEEDEKDEQLEEEAPKEEKPLINAFPYEINGVEYLLPEEVINYIESLKTSKIEVEEKLTKMADETPSAKPIGAVVKPSETITPMDAMNARFEALERFKEWKKNRR